MNVPTFTEVVIVPYYSATKAQIEQIESSLCDKERFLSFVDTAELIIPNTAAVDLSVAEIAIPDQPVKSIGTVRFQVRWSKAILNENQLSVFANRVTLWVRSVLAATKGQDWVGYIYTILVLSQTDENLKQELEKNPALIAKVVPGLQFPGAVIDQNYVKKLVGEDLGAQKTDCYLFALHGALIYDVAYAYSKDYINTRVIPLVGNLQCVQMYCELELQHLSKVLAAQLRNESPPSFEELGRLRESILLVLANSQQPVGFRQLTDISKRLTTVMGLDTFRTRLNDELEALDSVAQRVSDARSARFNRLISYLTIILALIALPEIASFLSWLSGRL